MGKRANENLAKDGLNSICLYAMPAGRFPITKWLTMIEIMALTHLIICQYYVARGMGINRITVIPVKSSAIHKYCHCFIRTLLSDVPKHFTVYLFGLPNKTEAQSKVMCKLFPVNPWVCKRKQHIILNIFPVSIFHFNLIYQHYIFCKTHFRILTSMEVIYSVEFLQWHCHSPERFYQPHHKTPENISPSSSVSHSLVF